MSGSFFTRVGPRGVLGIRAFGTEGGSASAGAAAGQGYRDRSGVHPCTHSLPRPSMAAAATPPARHVFGCVGVVAPVMANASPDRKADRDLRRSGHSRSYRRASVVAGAWPADEGKGGDTWHWLLAMSSRRAKPPPKRRPRTSCPGGRAQVAQGCATTRVRTGRPVEGCAIPLSDGGPFRSRDRSPSGQTCPNPNPNRQRGVGGRSCSADPKSAPAPRCAPAHR